MTMWRKLFSLLAGAMLGGALLASGTTTAFASSAATCSGGPIAAGTYQSLTITGLCQIASGNVTVQGNLVIMPGGGLLAAFYRSNLTVDGNLLVGTNGLLILGCEPDAFPCFNDPNAVPFPPSGTPGFQTSHLIAGDMVASGATLVLVHHNSFEGDISQTGGGGGLTCNSLFPNGPPPYTTYEDNRMGGDVTVTGLHTCWSGFFRNAVPGDVTWNSNVTLDPDGNEISANTIQGDLACFGNSPAMQFGDSGGSASTVFGDALGQCTGVLVTQPGN